MRLSSSLFVLLVGLALAACAAPQAGDSKLAAKDGMLQLYVPAGEFIMGSADPESPMDEQPQHTVHLDAFWIDQTEVTNAMYAQCVEAAACPAIITPRHDPATYPDLPASGITWTGAQAYCAWVGRRLPSEAEWEKAARGTDGHLYPWGDQQPDGSLANFDFVVDELAPVGSYPAGASPYGALDMAGNVYEWVQDWYDETYYSASPSENPSGPEFAITRVVRGGAWNGQAVSLRAANRFWAFPYRNDFDGFRCAAD